MRFPQSHISPSMNKRHGIEDVLIQALIVLRRDISQKTERRDTAYQTDAKPNEPEQNHRPHGYQKKYSGRQNKRNNWYSHHHRWSGSALKDSVGHSD